MTSYWLDSSKHSHLCLFCKWTGEVRSGDYVAHIETQSHRDAVCAEVHTDNEHVKLHDLRTEAQEAIQHLLATARMSDEQHEITECVSMSVDCVTAEEAAAITRAAKSVAATRAAPADRDKVIGNMLTIASRAQCRASKRERSGVILENAYKQLKSRERRKMVDTFFFVRAGRVTTGSSKEAPPDSRCCLRVLDVFNLLSTALQLSFCSPDATRETRLNAQLCEPATEASVLELFNDLHPAVLQERWMLLQHQFAGLDAHTKWCVIGTVANISLAQLDEKATKSASTKKQRSLPTSPTKKSSVQTVPPLPDLGDNVTSSLADATWDAPPASESATDKTTARGPESTSFESNGTVDSDAGPAATVVHDTLCRTRSNSGGTHMPAHEGVEQQAKGAKDAQVCTSSPLCVVSTLPSVVTPAGGGSANRKMKRKLDATCSAAEVPGPRCVLCVLFSYVEQVRGAASLLELYSHSVR